MSKEHAYAYEAGYRDGSINYELEHCPACKNVADLQEVLDENAKLRGARDVWQENDAKLRELIADLWEYIYIGTAQDRQSLHDRTRELGIEVDE